MTVCIASMFNWNYGLGNAVDLGKAIITMSDRQLTAGDVEYEPEHLKMTFFTPHTVCLVAGDFPTHSEAVLRTHRQLLAAPETDPGVIAELYAGFLREVKLKYAVQTHLAPVGLDQQSFYDNMKEFAPEFLNRLTVQLQNYEAPETEAIIAGTDGTRFHILLIDRWSVVSNHTDVGFAAIGIGASHAKSQLMQARYSHSVFNFSAALALTYVAKKRSEIAPGVGKETDMFLITRAGREPILPLVKTKMHEIYEDFERKRNDLGAQAIRELDAFIGSAKPNTNSAPSDSNPPQSDSNPTISSVPQT